MIRLAAAASALLSAGVQDSAPESHSPPPAQSVAAPAVAVQSVAAQVTVRQQIIVRVPRPQVRTPAATVPVQWRETAGPRCISAKTVEAAMPGAGRVDIVLSNNRRVRARLGQRCTGLNYYRGLYVHPNSDGRICAGRDIVRSRMGGQCEIVEFRTLQPVRP